MVFSFKRPTFRDHLLQQEFSKNGYVIVDLADPAVFHRLLEDFYHLYPLDQEGCFFSCRDADAKRRLYAQSLLRRAIRMNVLTLLDDYEFVSGSFVAKHPGDKSIIQPHTDFTFVDHHHYSAVAVWAPLTELTSQSGRLHVLPGSHLYTPMSGSNLFRTFPHISISQMIELAPKIGQAICYDLQIIHASPANQSPNSRIASNCVFAPKAAQLLHVTQRDERIYRYAVDLNFYSTISGDPNATQDLLQRYPILDSQPTLSSQDKLFHDSTKNIRARPLQWLINHTSRFCERWM
jgi:ectoine hydroxylase-related dioxygenase (phytanoyl-CoA dioxygenase family)